MSVVLGRICTALEELETHSDGELAVSALEHAIEHTNDYHVRKRIRRAIKLIQAGDNAGAVALLNGLSEHLIEVIEAAIRKHEARR